MYDQCNVLPPNKIILSCSNVMGIDTFPASRPQQSNFKFMNGIHGFTLSKIYEKYYTIKIPSSITFTGSDELIDFKVGTTLTYLNKNGKPKLMTLNDNGLLTYSHKSKVYFINPNGKLSYKIKR